jgi:hypothetical protein
MVASSAFYFAAYGVVMGLCVADGLEHEVGIGDVEVVERI